MTLQDLKFSKEMLEDHILRLGAEEFLATVEMSIIWAKDKPFHIRKELFDTTFRGALNRGSITSVAHATANINRLMKDK